MKKILEDVFTRYAKYDITTAGQRNTTVEEKLDSVSIPSSPSCPK